MPLSLPSPTPASIKSTLEYTRKGTPKSTKSESQPPISNARLLRPYGFVRLELYANICIFENVEFGLRLESDEQFYISNISEVEVGVRL